MEVAPPHKLLTQLSLLTLHALVLKVAAHGAHVRGTKASLGGPKSWWTRKLISFES